MAEKKPLRPKPKRFFPQCDPLQQIVPMVSQQLVNVMNTQTSHDEVPRTFKIRLKHVFGSYVEPYLSALHRNWRTFGNTLMLPVRRLG